MRERIIVVAIAPGAYIYQETCAQVSYYRNASKWKDPIPHIDSEGAARSKETIVDLVSHPDTGLFDHGFQSLTYYEILERNVRKYLENRL